LSYCKHNFFIFSRRYNTAADIPDIADGISIYNAHKKEVNRTPLKCRYNNLKRAAGIKIIFEVKAYEMFEVRQRVKFYESSLYPCEKQEGGDEILYFMC